MDIKYLKSLFEMFDESEAVELKIEEEGSKIYLAKNKVKEVKTAEQTIVQPQPRPEAIPQPIPTPETNTEPALEKPSDNGLEEIKSPIVGTFYRAPSPDSDPFVQVGDKVKPGQTLCIVEAMKLMNEIEAEIAGTIEKILLENAEPVEFDQPMFLIKPE